MDEDEFSCEYAEYCEYAVAWECPRFIALHHILYISNVHLSPLSSRSIRSRRVQTDKECAPNVCQPVDCFTEKERDLFNALVESFQCNGFLYLHVYCLTSDILFQHVLQKLRINKSPCRSRYSDTNSIGRLYLLEMQFSYTGTKERKVVVRERERGELHCALRLRLVAVVLNLN